MNKRICQLRVFLRHVKVFYTCSFKSLTRAVCKIQPASVVLEMCTAVAIESVENFYSDWNNLCDSSEPINIHSYKVYKSSP